MCATNGQTEAQQKKAAIEEFLSRPITKIDPTIKKPVFDEEDLLEIVRDGLEGYSELIARLVISDIRGSLVFRMSYNEDPKTDATVLFRNLPDNLQQVADDDDEVGDMITGTSDLLDLKRKGSDPSMITVPVTIPYEVWNRAKWFSENLKKCSLDSYVTNALISFVNADLNSCPSEMPFSRDLLNCPSDANN